MILATRSSCCHLLSVSLMKNVLPQHIEHGVCRPALTNSLVRVSEQCTRCQRCVFECAFLKQYGDPKTIADSFDPDNRFFLQLPHECNLCSHCTAVCSHGVDPKALFLEIRREAVVRGVGELPEHNGLRRYEQVGTSQRYSWYGLPEGCDTVFFPGCSLTGSRPETTLKSYELLQSMIPSVGIVLDCCTKPSHDLGDEDYFQAMFGEMTAFLREHGVKQVLTACPNCYEVFKDYGEGLTTRSVYEVLNGRQCPGGVKLVGSVIVHDPCVARFDTTSQQAVRDMLETLGLKVEETEYSREKTLCCGKGGGAGYVAPDKTRIWATKLLGGVHNRPLVSYCASCTKVFAKETPTHHLLDLLFAPEGALAGKARETRAPMTYLNRLKVKKQLRRTLSTAVTRERTFHAGESKTKSKLGKQLLIGLLPVALGLLLLSRGIFS